MVLDITGFMDWLADLPSTYLTATVWVLTGLSCIALPLVMARILNRPDPGPVWARPAAGTPDPAPLLPGAAPPAAARVAIDSAWPGYDTGEFQWALTLHTSQEPGARNGNGNGQANGHGTWTVPSAEELRDAAIAELAALRRMDAPRGRDQRSQYPFS